MHRVFDQRVHAQAGEPLEVAVKTAERCTMFDRECSQMRVSNQVATATGAETAVLGANEPARMAPTSTPTVAVSAAVSAANPRVMGSL